MPSSGDTLSPIQLPYWPTCKNALTWSPEDLAVAAGEVVHILTPRDPLRPQEVAGHPQWHTYTLRVNTFEQTEWPYQTLAPLSDFSLGEELSESTVVSLAWSPPGLGLYRRSILAVLTSNLVLSFWESNGKVGAWKRTCIVNQHLPIADSHEVPDNSRRKRRIRAFCWFPLLPRYKTSKWAPQLLAVADDDRTVLVYRVDKRTMTAFGGWSFELMAKQTVQNIEAHMDGMNTLRTILSTSSPISSLETTKWHTQEGPDGASQAETITLTVRLGQCTQPKHFSVRVERMMGKSSDDSRPAQDLRVVMVESQLAEDQGPQQPSWEPHFEPAIQKLRSEFSAQFNLGGAVRVKNWGTTASFDGNNAAACISCHPSDMIEYGMPSSQRTVVVFAQLQQPSLTENSNTTKSDGDVYEEIINFIVDTPRDWVKTSMDRNIVRNTAALILSDFKDRSSLVHWASTTTGLLSNNDGRANKGTTVQESNSMDVDGEADAILEHDNTSAASSADEICEICEAGIPFTSPSDAARCANGHQFSRCCLSFVAIQEPGISKYCARCGRQFLDPGHLEFGDGPSLSQALFDKFDVCPYCHGKFRG